MDLHKAPAAAPEHLAIRFKWSQAGSYPSGPAARRPPHAPGCNRGRNGTDLGLRLLRNASYRGVARFGVESGVWRARVRVVRPRRGTGLALAFAVGSGWAPPRPRDFITHQDQPSVTHLSHLGDRVSELLFRSVPSDRIISDYIARRVPRPRKGPLISTSHLAAPSFEQRRRHPRL